MSPIHDYLVRLYERDPRGFRSSSSGSRSSGSSGSAAGANRGTGALRGSSSSSGSSNSGSSSGSSSRRIPSTGSPGASSSKSTGGGTGRIIAKGLVFAGRKYGGGRRPLIGGGLAYGAGYGAYRYGRVGGLGFPFGFWPLFYGPRYYDNDEYGPSDNSSRPGGPLASSSFSAPLPSPNSTTPQYLIHGDTTSISTILDSLTTQCSALIIVPSTPLLGDNSYPPSTNLSLLPTPNPANIQQYYRDSSFALYAYFDDLIPSPEASINFTAPSLEPFIYAAALRNTTFDACVNATISENLPIEEGTSGVVRIGMLLQGVGVGAKGQLVMLALVVGMWGRYRWCEGGDLGRNGGFVAVIADDSRGRDQGRLGAPAAKVTKKREVSARSKLNRVEILGTVYVAGVAGKVRGEGDQGGVRGKRSLPALVPERSIR